MMGEDFDLGDWFKPEKLKPVNFVTGLFAILIIFGFAPVVGVAIGGNIAVLSILGILVIIGLYYGYVLAFYKTVGYRIGEEDVEYKGGVFFKKQTSVPYNRITHVDTRQGPVLRFFDAGAVEIQTAGNSGQYAGPELVIKSVEDFEEIKELVRYKANKSSETSQKEKESSENVSETVKELRKIREILEQEL